VQDGQRVREGIAQRQGHHRRVRPLRVEDALALSFSLASLAAGEQTGASAEAQGVDVGEQREGMPGEAVGVCGGAAGVALEEEAGQGGRVVLLGGGAGWG
jgi:hypothetical protein